MKEALFYRKLKDNFLQCTLCPHLCTIKQGEIGKCLVRKNIDGTLFSLVYGRPVLLAVDPIEKKPLFHFLPASKAFSIGTYGCNFDCKNCQNFKIARTKPDEKIPFVSPQQIVDLAIESECESIAYTYTEPTVFYEYVLDIAMLAKKAGLKNILVTNGFINKEPLIKLLPFIDAANIDLKGNKKHYESVCAGRIDPILETIKTMHDCKIHIEITNLIIPTLNDSKKDIEFICRFVSCISDEIPVHFSAFYPHYKLIDLPKTSEKTLLSAKKIAEKYLIKYIYLGNIFGYESTYCPKCKKLLIKRSGFSVEQINITDSHCTCGQKISGFWKNL